MQKVYLLLRSNKQTGPYSLEELLQLNLKPFDLVWMEGRSAAWQYPSEIPSLKPYVPETPHADVPFKPVSTSVMEENTGQTLNSKAYKEPQNPIPQKPESVKRVFVTVPKNYVAAADPKTHVQQNDHTEHQAYMPSANEALYERKEEVKQAMPSYSQSYAQQKPAEEVHTNYARSLNQVEEEYTSWMYRQKTKKKPAVNPKDLVLAVLVLAVIAGGYYIMSKPSVTNSVLPGNQTAQIIQQPTEPGGVEPQKENPTASPVEKTGSASGTVSSKPLKNTKKKNPVSVSKSQTSASVPSSKNPMPVEKTTPNILTTTGAVADKETEVKQQPKTGTTSPEKKKRLGDVLKNIFAKKDKKEEPQNNEVVLENPKPADNRQAQRRGTDETTTNDQPSEKPSEISTAALAGQIDIYTNSNDNWMMGVKNLKVTLRNRSNVTIQTASVTVNYYNENNELLEKKLIYFNNVGPKTKAVVTAPDNKWADHVDFKLAAVSAKDDRYARY